MLKGGMEVVRSYYPNYARGPHTRLSAAFRVRCVFCFDQVKFPLVLREARPARVSCFAFGVGWSSASSHDFSYFAGFINQKYLCVSSATGLR